MEQKYDGPTGPVEVWVVACFDPLASDVNLMKVGVRNVTKVTLRYETKAAKVVSLLRAVLHGKDDGGIDGGASQVGERCLLAAPIETLMARNIDRSTVGTGDCSREWF